MPTTAARRVPETAAQLGFAFEQPRQTEVRKPFLKWAGNKVHIMETLRAEMERVQAVAGPFRRYLEPFVGSAAAALNLPQFLGIAETRAADINADLVNLFRQARADAVVDGECFAEACGRLFPAQESNGRKGEGRNDDTEYYARRARFNELRPALERVNSLGAALCPELRERAALFVYLNRHGFNGLCRYNQAGDYNVSFGKYKQPYFPSAELAAFQSFSDQHPVEFVHQGFEEMLAAAGAGDLVYCDPPYVPLSETANFTAYASEGFGADDQLRLAQMAQAAAERGAWVVVSNHDTPLARALYDGSGAGAEHRLLCADVLQGWKPANGRILATLQVQRRISRDASTRGAAPELLAVFGPAPLLGAL